MSFAPVIDALGFPQRPRGTASAQETPLGTRRAHRCRQAQIQDGIEEIIWVAALKPTNIGVPAFEDVVRQYLEIAVLTVELRPAPSRRASSS